MKTPTKRTLWATALATLAATSPLWASSARDAIVAGYAAAAGGGGFSAERGKALFYAQHTGGKPDTPSCTTCHTNDPRKAGTTRVGKPIDPMAVSRTPDRFTDLEKVEKWFGRNCNSVLGRDCSAQEKGDVIAYLSSI